MKQYKRLNIIFGWLVFVISAFVYISTIEPTASFWDCGEFIATAYKLLVGHPPGAPFFMIMGRFFSLFAPDPGSVAAMINIMSALASAFTIMFLFWTITHLARKIFIHEDEEYEEWRGWAVIGSGLVGSLAYTFSDTFWFSAVEGEVYAMSSLFTAIVFWAILKWENVADQPNANRWLILIAYLMGLSIGVHLLNLLAIPAIVMVYYFKKFEVTRANTIKALALSAVILGGILYGIIPGLVKVASWFELLFVNGFGMPYNTGVIVYSILLIGSLVYGILWTHKNGRKILNTIILAVTVIIIGYSSFAMIVIRSYANPPMDQNSPEDVFSLMSYLNREQYGDRPLFNGQNFNTPIKTVNRKAKPIYIKKNGKYEIVDYKPEYVFDENTKTVFPRMYSREQRHINEYKKWTDFKGRRVTVTDESGKPKIITVPTLWDNIKFFWEYQVKYMYFRYFMWNFSGRQNDLQGNGEIDRGNWITGIPAIDNSMYGDQDLLRDSLKNNRAHNKYYLLPLLLGLAGMFYQYNANRKGKDGKIDNTGKHGFWIVMLLFLFTGLAIVLYLNQTPLQPRERDYAYAGSFYAFTIWIGLGVLALVDALRKVLPGKVSAVAATVISLALVPGIMAKENWDDHDRSGRYVARDLAWDYLNSCQNDAILFTNGDNDTFPLWYIQEVEGVRTDVRVCNLSYLQTDWYIDQMKRKAYKSDPLPFSLKHDQYVAGSRDVVYIVPREQFKGKRINLKEAIKFVASDNPRTKSVPGYGGRIDYLPAKNFYVKADSLKVLQKGYVSESAAHLIQPEIDIDINKNMILKNELMIYDLISNNDWNRPVYFAVTVGSDNYAGLQNYFQLEGFGYQVVPIRTQKNNLEYGRVDTEKMYNNVMNKFKWGGFNNPDVYLDENHRRMAVNIRNNMTRLANALLDEGKKDKAVDILNKLMEEIPPSRVPHDQFSVFLAEAYYKAGEFDKGDEIMRDVAKEFSQNMRFYASLDPSKKSTVMPDIERSLAIFGQLILPTIQQYGRKDLLKELNEDYRNSLNELNFLSK
ncbi:MAG: DUF2723 domain-containing protein [Chlorobi bacterium]|nr:DUF2723 domain-containing protein [Chlorobiota bacterium]